MERPADVDGQIAFDDDAVDLRRHALRVLVVAETERRDFRRNFFFLPEKTKFLSKIVFQRHQGGRHRSVFLDGGKI